MWFPVVDAAKQRSREGVAAASQKSKSKPVNIDFQGYKEVKAKMDVVQERYTQAGIEHVDLRKVTDKIKSIRNQIDALNSQVNGASRGAVSVSPLASRPPPSSKY